MGTSLSFIEAGGGSGDIHHQPSMPVEAWRQLAFEVGDRYIASQGSSVDPVSPLVKGGLVSFFEGRSRGDASGRLYRIERYTVTDGNKRDLTQLATQTYLDTYPGRDRNIAVERMLHGLSHPRTVLQLAIYDDRPIGMAILRKMSLLVGTPGKRERVGYSSRAVLEEHEGDGLGTMFLRDGIKAQEEDGRPLDAVALMTQNVLSIITLRKALERIGFGGIIHPFDELYTGDRAREDLLLLIHKEVRLKSDLIKTWNGVSEGELKELGSNERVYKPERGTQAWEYNERMVREWGVNRERGDVVYVIAMRNIPDTSAESVLALPEAT